MLKYIVFATLGFASATVCGAPIVVDPDSYAAGTDISNGFAGVSLSLYDPPGASGLPPVGSSIFSRETSIPVAGNRTFSFRTNDGDLRPIFVLFLEGLRADFSTAVGFVSIDFITDDSFDPGTLQAFDLNGNLLEEAFTPGAVPFGGVETATISRSQNDIAYILAGGSGTQGVYLDNLQFEVLAVSPPSTVPEPASMLLWTIALGCALRFRPRNMTLS
jgi:hypothetical protein